MPTTSEIQNRAETVQALFQPLLDMLKKTVEVQQGRGVADTLTIRIPEVYELRHGRQGFWGKMTDWLTDEKPSLTGYTPVVSAEAELLRRLERTKDVMLLLEETPRYTEAYEIEDAKATLGSAAAYFEKKPNYLTQISPNIDVLDQRLSSYKIEKIESRRRSHADIIVETRQDRGPTL